MKKYLIAMGGFAQGKNRWNFTRDYNAEVERLFQSTNGYFDGMIRYNNDWLHQSKYYQDPKVKMVLDLPSFGGVYKPICILDTMNKMDVGDVVMMIDSNHAFIDNPDPLIKFTVDHNIFCHDHFIVSYPNCQWTFKDTFIGMGCDEERYWNAPQIQVNITAFCKNDFTMMFVEEWLKYCGDYNVVATNIYKNLPLFVENRFEQSVISILVEKYHIPLQADPNTIILEKDGINVNR